MKKCAVCKETLSLDSFATNRARRDGLHDMCRSCKKDYNKSYYERTKQVHNPSRYARTEQIRQETRERLLDYFSVHPCVDCGIRDVRVLEFDHLRDKTYNIASMLHFSWAKVLQEIEKCEVVCANCHRIRTGNRNNSYRNLGGNADMVRHLALTQE